jgi:hypothetical protein
MKKISSAFIINVFLLSILLLNSCISNSTFNQEEVKSFIAEENIEWVRINPS